MEFMLISGWSAIGLSSCLYFSLSLPFFKVLRCKQNFEYTPIGLINTIYVDCFTWYIYGMKLLSEQIMFGNKIGICTTLSLMAIYLGFELKKYTVDTILNILILILGTLVIHKGLTMIIEDTQIIGKICIVTKLITFSNPMLLMFQVFKDRNYGVISLRDSVLFFLSSIAWTLFGKSTNDINVICANGCAIVFGLIEIIVYLHFKKKYGYNYNSTKTIGIESSQVEEQKKEEITEINNDEEKQDNIKEKPVKIVTKIDS
jgi:solute carrier family 50 protein (sugar transporter)